MNTTPDFDLESVYDSEISPLMDEIIRICRRENIPVLASFCFRQEDGEAHFCTTAISRNGWAPPEFRSALQLIRKGFIAFAVTAKETK